MREKRPDHREKIDEMRQRIKVGEEFLLHFRRDGGPKLGIVNRYYLAVASGPKIELVPNYETSKIHFETIGYAGRVTSALETEFPSARQTALFVPPTAELLAASQSEIQAWINDDTNRREIYSQLKAKLDEITQTQDGQDSVGVAAS